MPPSVMLSFRGRAFTLNSQLSTINSPVTSLEKALRDFAQFAAKLKGDEKSEAQTFLFHLLAAFGHEANNLPEGSTFEYRVRFPGERTKYADFVWPGRALIEMKSRGVKLTAKCSTLTARFRYTSDTVFDTFPWPQFKPDQPSRHAAIPKGLNHSAQGCEERATLGNAPPPPANSERVASPPVPSRSPSAPAPVPHSALAKVRAVAETAVALRALRREIMAANGWSLRDLYRTLETPGANRLRDAHAALDSAVRAAYGMTEKEDPLAFLLRLNLQLADLESKAQPITPPGLPTAITDPGDFATPDCIQPASGRLPITST